MPRNRYQKGNCIYIIVYSGMNGMFKVGKTKNMNTRISSYITCNPHEVHVLHMRFVENMTLVENILKVTLKPFHFIGEGGKEWYRCDDVEIIKDEINTVINFLQNRISKNLAYTLSNQDKDTLTLTDDEQIDQLINEGRLALCSICCDFFTPKVKNQIICCDCVS